jgi:5-(carboxyamino)imidazole ribonucleotide mutase
MAAHRRGGLMDFKDKVASAGGAVILAGSGSDAEHIKTLEGALEAEHIPFQTRICSAHKQPEKLISILKEYDGLPGKLAYIAVAGGTDALSGTVAFHSTRPVISCPPDAPNKSCLTNPPGSSNVYIENPSNVAEFLQQYFSNPATHVAVVPSRDDSPRQQEHENKVCKALEGYGIETKKVISSGCWPARLSELATLSPLAAIGLDEGVASDCRTNAHVLTLCCCPLLDHFYTYTQLPISFTPTIMKPQNVGRFVAQMLSATNPAMKERILAENARKVAELYKQDAAYFNR